MCLLLGLTAVLGLRTPLQADTVIKSAEEEPAVFAESSAFIPVLIHHDQSPPAARDYTVRLVQVSAWLSMPVGGPRPWKTIVLAPDETLRESVPIQLPHLRAITPFQLEILEDNQRIARIPFWGCPTNLMHHLTAMAGSRPLGLYDPQDRMKALLNRTSVPWEPVAAPDRNRKLTCAMAILGPFPGQETLPTEAATLAQTLTRENIAVIMLCPPGTLGGTETDLRMQRVAGKAQTRTASLLSVEFNPALPLDSARAQLALYQMAQIVLGHTLPKTNNAPGHPSRSDPQPTP
jgi:hypothetical protein